MKDNEKDPLEQEEAATETEHSIEDKVIADTESEVGELVSEKKIENTANVSRTRRLKKWYVTQKKLSIPATCIVLLLLLMAVPFTRFALAGMVLKQKYSIAVYDQTTKKPVSSATVFIDGVQVSTDNEGHAVIKAHVGKHQLKITKKYYKDSIQNVTVPILKQKNTPSFSIQATGRQVPVVVTNLITGKPVENIKIVAAGSESKTDKDGKAVIVLPTTSSKETAKLSGSGFNAKSITISVVDQSVQENTFTVTPSGKLYFLSKLTGKIDVVKTDLDGANRQTVLAGTGSEEEAGTVLLASRDWKYLALLSRRDSDKAKLYLIETDSDKQSVMDEGDANFTLSGWSDSTFVYRVSRNNVEYSEANKDAIKSFNASTKKLTTLDQNTSETVGNGKFYSGYDTVDLVNGRVVYTTHISSSNQYNYGQVPTQKAAIYSVNTDGTDKKTLKTFPAGDYGYSWNQTNFSTSVKSPNQLILSVSPPGGTQYYEYANDQLKAFDNEYDTNATGYKTFLLSPSGKETLWYEPRDGKNTLLIGDGNASGAKIVTNIDTYVPYGWYTDDYLLVSKGSSELYILPASEKVATSNIIKVSDYHKPAYSFYGYGGGYGGL